MYIVFEVKKKMNMIFTDDTLFIDLKGDMDVVDINIIKERIFSVLDQYNIDKIVLNTKGAFNINKKLIGNIKREYSMKYMGTFKII